jgi:hypothetical protein
MTKRSGNPVTLVRPQQPSKRISKLPTVVHSTKAAPGEYPPDLAALFTYGIDLEIVE